MESGFSHKVLLVDDDIDLQEMVALALRLNNIEAYCASNSTQMFTYLEKETCDVIILDIYLGGEDGWQISQDLKRSPVYKDIPILLYSAGGHDFQALLEKSGADDFIPKPFDICELVERIERLAKRMLPPKVSQGAGPL